jgi:DNA-binding MarR family transcriptional regulator
VHASREQMVTVIDDLLRQIMGGYLRTRRPPHGELTVAQFHCLRTIGRMESPSMSALSRELRLHPSTVTALVDVLVERGLVRRRDDPHDRRVVRVEFTEKARQERERHQRAMRRRVMGLLGDLGDEELRSIHGALSILHAAALRRGDEDRQGQPRRETSRGEPR